MKYSFFALIILVLFSSHLYSGTLPNLTHKKMRKIDRQLQKQERKKQRIQNIQNRLEKLLKKRLEKQHRKPNNSKKVKGVFKGFLRGLLVLGLIALAFFTTGGIQILAITLLAFASVIFLVFFFTLTFSNF